jgi:hypothetical protein
MSPLCNLFFLDSLFGTDKARSGNRKTFKAGPRMNKKEGPCMINVTLRRVLETSVAVEKQ